jgi:hypothetical protein
MVNAPYPACVPALHTGTVALQQDQDVDEFGVNMIHDLFFLRPRKTGELHQHCVNTPNKKTILVVNTPQL